MGCVSWSSVGSRSPIPPRADTCGSGVRRNFDNYSKSTVKLSKRRVTLGDPAEETTRAVTTRICATHHRIIGCVLTILLDSDSPRTRLHIYELSPPASLGVRNTFIKSLPFTLWWRNAL